MQKSIVLLALLISVSIAHAQKIPSVVQSAFQKQYPDVKKVKWDKESSNYEANFQIDKIDHSVLIDASGTIIETEIAISVESLPAKVKDYILKNYPGQKIKEAAKIIDRKNVLTYEAEVKGNDLIFDSNGNFIKEEKD